jgi:hypothetical protein
LHKENLVIDSFTSDDNFKTDKRKKCCLHITLATHSLLDLRMRKHLLLQITLDEDEYSTSLTEKCMLLQHLSTCQTYKHIGVTNNTVGSSKFARFNPTTSLVNSDVTSLGLPRAAN